jgi:UDP-N-acetylmuramate dehydrogenase
MTHSAVVAALGRHGTVALDVPMARHTTFGIGGPADIFVTVSDIAALGEVVRVARDAGQPLFVLGSGSNILVSDRGIRGVVLDNRARQEQAGADGLNFRVASGASFAAFARRMCRQGRAGLAWAVGIPGTLGGAVVYNAGAYGGCLADVLRRVSVAASDGTRWREASELDLVYRGSVFTRGAFTDQVVLEVEVGLTRAPAAELTAEAASYDRRRLSAQPRGRNAGSMFKNPPESPAWKLIDAVGMRGMRAGDAAISDQHCNFFVNYGQASAADVASLVSEAERRVFERFGVRLVREVSFAGDWS